MNRTSLAVSTLALAVTLGFPAEMSAQGQSGQTQGQSQAKPDPATESKAAPTGFAGKWIVTVQTQNGPLESTLVLKLDGKKVTGTITSQMGETTVEGEQAENKLTFWMTMDANGQSMSITFVGTPQKDGSLAGTLNFGQGEIPWTAVRPKGEK